MSVTVVTRRLARPGQAEALFELASRRMVDMARGRHARRHSLLFQGVVDRHLLVRVGHWDGLDEYWAAMEGLGGFDPLDALCVGGGERSFFERRVLHEDMGQKAQTVDCALLRAPRGAGAAIYDEVLLPNMRTLRAQPGMILSALYQDLDDRDRYFVLHGWGSLAAQQTFLGELGRTLEAQLLAQHVQVERYVVHTRVEIDRYARHQPDQPPDG